MISLFLDTSTANLIIAIFKNDKQIYYSCEKSNNDLSRKVLPKIDEAFKSLNISKNKIDEIYVVNGPGSFTGIRVGVTIAKVLAWSLNIRIYVVSSLELLATADIKTKYIVPLIDARRDYFYAGIYSENKIIMEDAYISRSTLLEKINEIDSIDKFTFVSFDNINEINTVKPDIHIDKILGTKVSINPHKVNPNYLKKTEAEEKRNR